MAKTKQKKKVDKIGNLDNRENLFELIKSTENLDTCIPRLTDHLKKIVEKSEIGEKYQVIFLYDPEKSITDFTTDKLYKSIDTSSTKDLMLIVHSQGGSVEPAYFISKFCKSYPKKFITCVPRKAKSAATLLSLGADEIHMGDMSQLGPIDPQIGGLPALGLSNAVNHIASICKIYPESSDMFARYLSYELPLIRLGYFERVSESAVQYAQRLLDGKSFPGGKEAGLVSAHLVYSYKDHGFVIDKDEAKKLLGSMIKEDTPEYKLGDEIYRFLEDVYVFSKIVKKKDLTAIGSLENAISFLDTPTNN